MNHWTYIAAAYAITFFGTMALIWHSVAQLRRSEAALAAQKDQS